MPDKVVLQIFSYLSHREICRLARTCRKWRMIAYDSRLWKSVSLRPEMSGLHVSSLEALLALIRYLLIRLFRIVPSISMIKSCFNWNPFLAFDLDRPCAISNYPLNWLRTQFYTNLEANAQILPTCCWISVQLCNCTISTSYRYASLFFSRLTTPKWRWHCFGRGLVFAIEMSNWMTPYVAKTLEKCIVSVETSFKQILRDLPMHYFVNMLSGMRVAQTK